MPRYQDLVARLERTATLASIGSVLSWDQETTMPAGGAPHRARQLALVARLSHESFVCDEVRERIEACEADAALMADPVRSASLREIRRDFDRASRLPADLVAEISETNSKAIHAWKAAREADSFSDFLPWLERQVALNLRAAECYGAPEGGTLYDALLQGYEPDATEDELQTRFEPLREATVTLLQQVREASNEPDDALEQVRVEDAAQHALHNWVLDRIGFDLQRGRLDISTHPFSIGLGAGDTRLTTRFAGCHFADSLGSTLHEAGHALYEQGIPDEPVGEPLHQAVSLGIHESQSRLWENHVGRSRAFWTWIGPEARDRFHVLNRFDDDALYRGVNRVSPNLIRVESDELTYNLHILLRFDLERAMLRGDLAVRDLPSAWNDRIRSDLGIDVPDDRRGCLQDIHWAMGSFGYFPTYTLGNLYAAQLWESLAEAVGDVDGAIGRGNFAPILNWLREQVHRHGRLYRAGEVCERASGKPLDHRPLLRHLQGKLSDVYGLEPSLSA